MQKFRCFLFVLRLTYACYYILCMAVPLNYFRTTLNVTNRLLIWAGKVLYIGNLQYPNFTQIKLCSNKNAKTEIIFHAYSLAKFLLMHPSWFLIYLYLSNIRIHKNRFGRSTSFIGIPCFIYIYTILTFSIIIATNGTVIIISNYKSKSENFENQKSFPRNFFYDISEMSHQQ